MKQTQFNLSAPLPPIEEAIKQKELNFVKVVPHPTGGFTLAVPINQESGSGRIYHQWFQTEEAAQPFCDQHNRDLCRRYGRNLAYKNCIQQYLVSRKKHGSKKV